MIIYAQFRQLCAGSQQTDPTYTMINNSSLQTLPTCISPLVIRVRLSHFKNKSFSSSPCFFAVKFFRWSKDPTLVSVCNCPPPSSFHPLSTPVTYATTSRVLNRKLLIAIANSKQRHFGVIVTSIPYLSSIFMGSSQISGPVGCVHNLLRLCGIDDLGKSLWI